MDLKKYDNYTDDERKKLLEIWFYCYNEKRFTEKEAESFSTMVKKNPKAMFDIALALYLSNSGPVEVLNAIRGDKTKISQILKNFKAEKVSEEDKADFIKKIVISYNDLEPNYPFNSVDFYETIKKNISDQPSGYINTLNFDALFGLGINNKKIADIFGDCLFRKEEIINGIPSSNFVKVYTLENDALILCASRLNKHKNEIKNILDLVISVGEEKSFNELGVNKRGVKWSKVREDTEMLIYLASGCGLLDFTRKRKYIEFNLPYYKRTNETPSKILGEAPHNLCCLKNYLQNEISTENMSPVELFSSLYKEMTEEEKKALELFGISIEIIDKEVFLHCPKLGVVKGTITLFPEKLVIKSEPYIELSFNLLSTKDNAPTIMKSLSYFLPDGVITVSLGTTSLDLHNNNSILISYTADPFNPISYVYSINEGQLVLEYSSISKDTRRSLCYSDLLKMPNNLHPFSIIEKDGTQYFNISINKSLENKIDEVIRHTSPNKDIFKTNINYLEDDKKANMEALEFINTTRVQNLYHNILNTLESVLPGIRDLIHNYHPFSLTIEEQMTKEKNIKKETLIENSHIIGTNFDNEDSAPKKRI